MTHLQDLIPGYQLTRLLGRGGFGEVWEAIAPGGVTKAVKFVADHRADGRSGQELRSLNRIKNVRHPFVLSIERIERLDDRLVIVTELGDMNLKERFEERQADGHQGIAADELLRLLRDAADALDHIYAEYGLQHLDVKPENMLLFGQHLKVADFGLVKNIYDRSVSQINAMTPVYSAPELVEGRPAKSTDQYALAIVYQHMLTGSLPFDGLTAAKLAAQHLRDVPDLSAVPDRQRPVLARALSKDAGQRFASCTELVEALSQTRPQGDTARRPAAAPRVAAPPDRTLPIPVPETRSSFAGETSREAVLPRPISKSKSESPATEGAGDEGRARPTIVIGVGGAGGRILDGFRRRIRERQGKPQDLPGLRLLQIDSDPADLSLTNEKHGATGECVDIPIPLLGSAEYRASADKFRLWLDRKWLFNVPRDLRTHGMRPFGRLALLSHAGRVRKTIQEVVEGIGASPRVFIVGSISGGTASGTMLDLAYLARHELRNAGWFDAPVDGVLVLAEPVGRQHDQAIAGSCAFLAEQTHFSRHGGYFPGTSAFKVPPFHGDNRTFHRTYVVDLGATAEPAHWNERIDDVAEFLYLSAQPGERGAIVRELSVEGEAEPVNVTQLAPPTGRFVDAAAWQLCVDVVDSLRGTYRGGDEQTEAAAGNVTLLIESLADPGTARLTDEAALAARFDSADLQVATLIAGAGAATEGELGRPVEEYLRKAIEEGLEKQSAAASGRGSGVDRLVTLVAELFHAAEASDQGYGPSGRLYGAVCDRLSTETQRIADTLVRQIRGLTDTFGLGVNGALAVAEASTDRVRRMQRDAVRIMNEHADRTDEMRSMLSEDPAAAAAGSTSRFGWLQVRRDRRANQQACAKLVDYGVGLADRLMVAAAFKQLRTIEAELVGLTESLQRLWQDLKRLHGLCVRGGTRDPQNAQARRPADRLEQYLFEAFRAERPALVRSAYESVGEHILPGERKLQRFLDGRADLCEEVSRPLYAECHSVVLRWIETVVGRSIGGPAAKGPSPEFRLDSAVAELLAARAGSDCVVVIPRSADSGVLQARLRRLGHEAAVVPGDVSGVALLEYQPRTSLVDLAEALAARAESSDRIWQLASTLHARDDVEWSAPVSRRPAATADGGGELSRFDPTRQETGHELESFSAGF